MRLQSLMFAIFSVIAVAPLGLFWFLPGSILSDNNIIGGKYSGIIVLIFGVILAGVLAWIAAKLITAPVEQMTLAMKRIGEGELRAHEKIKVGKIEPKEFNNARRGIEAMAKRLQENIDTISRHAYLDGITGLPNRECFRVLAQEQIERLQASNSRGAILFLDLDGFKQVNDVYGHRSGDDLLKAFAEKMHLYCGNEMKRRAFGADNAVNIIPARLGGDEFVVFIGNTSNVETIAEFASGLFRRVFGKFKLHNGVRLQVTGSVGGALFPDQAGDFDELLRLADIAMYKAKNGGKGRFCMHEEGDELLLTGHREPEPELPVQKTEPKEEFDPVLNAVWESESSIPKVGSG
ncbi:MAG: diguanylate cyclase domain-containing protein [Rhizobiaceae bacterium]